MTKKKVVQEKPVAPVVIEKPAEEKKPVVQGEPCKDLPSNDMFLLLQGSVKHRDEETSKAFEYVPLAPFQFAERIEKTPVENLFDYVLLGGFFFFMLFAAMVILTW